uniref:GST N-terminal domain-containing protein n=1 Tax=Trichobilharzia regenti TaxID=157069 RepID=A0AA85ITP3_TRIRE|nr:unnamed protein product [Trichobilharzia regenti]
MHLKQGDPKPEFRSDRLTLIGYRFCPYVDRVKLVLGYHKIDYDLVNISLTSKPDWFLELYPAGKVPLLLEKGKQLSESDVLMRHIDSVYGSGVLLSHCGEELFEKAKEIMQTITGPTYMLLSSPQISDGDVAHYWEACSKLNDAIKGPYFAGHDLSLADLLIFPHLQRFETIVGRINAKT